MTNVPHIHSYGVARTTRPTSFVRSIYVAGRNGPGTGGDGMFTWDPASVADDDGGTVLALASDLAALWGLATGRWVRAFSGPADARWFGAKCDGTTDDSEALSNAIAAYSHIRISGPLRFASGEGPVHVVFPDGVALYFDAPDAALVPDSGVTVTVSNVAIMCADGQTIVGGNGTVSGWPR